MDKTVTMTTWRGDEVEMTKVEFAKVWLEKLNCLQALVTTGSEHMLPELTQKVRDMTHAKWDQLYELQHG